MDAPSSRHLRDDAARAKWYPATKALPAGVVYGLTEFTAAEIPGAALVSCPGCYPTAALLAMQPLAEAGLLRPDAGTVSINGNVAQILPGGTGVYTLDADCTGTVAFTPGPGFDIVIRAGNKEGRMIQTTPGTVFQGTLTRDTP